MSLNPIQFGEHVVEQFQRYLRTYFPIADQRMEQQVREHLSRELAGQRELVKGPFVHLNRPFEPGPTLDELLDEPQLNLHPALPGLFEFEQLYKHQELAARAILNGKHTVMATATGSGKTEGFLLPILNHCLYLRDGEADPGVVALLVYPMNALVNDQMARLRRMLAGTRITFGRYTGETPHNRPDNIEHLSQPRTYTKAELRAASEEHERLPRPWEEAISRDEIQSRKPRLLLTNYRMVEYLLLRHRDLHELLRGAPLAYMVFDEVHTYTGILGSEVACLVRRIRHVAEKKPDELICIGTSATVRDDEDDIDGTELTSRFAHRLFGVPADDVEVVEEQHREFEAPGGDVYTPPRPDHARAMCDRVLDEAREVQLRDEVGEIPQELLAVTERLCGRKAPAEGTVNDRMYQLLAANEIIQSLSRRLTEPLTLENVLNRLRRVGDRQSADDDELTAEALAYLTLGAICHKDDEPLLRPKLHYFVQGYPGLYLSFEPDDPHAIADSDISPVVHFEAEPREGADSAGIRLPLYLCRACGQHYVRVMAEEAWASEDGGAIRPVRAAKSLEKPGEGEAECYITDRLHTEEETEGGKGETWYMCRYCGTLHDREYVNHSRGGGVRQESRMGGPDGARLRSAQAPIRPLRTAKGDTGEELREYETCQADTCKRKGPMVAVQVFTDGLTNCAACGARETVKDTRSAEVADVHALAESMLSGMREPKLRKLLVFSDNRQEAAFQAGWMGERSRRHELRHLLHDVLQDADGPLDLDALAEKLLNAAEHENTIEIGPKRSDLENAKTKINWFLLQEFASPQQRRGSLEGLGLAEVSYEDLSVDRDAGFFERWAEAFDAEPGDVVNVVRQLLDYYRRRKALSHELLQHAWQYRDPEVRAGLISVHEHWHPAVLTLSKVEANIAKTLVAERGETGAQHLVGKAFRNGNDHIDEFLVEVWEWLQDSEHPYLEAAVITRAGHGTDTRVKIGGPAAQVNAGLVMVGSANGRFVCDVCRGVQSVPTPTGACPEYRCDGQLRGAQVDRDHYAVVRYTEEDLVPLRVEEHSGQVSGKQREEIEAQFKEDEGDLNCLVCTPTLELGVDIGQLEMALMRNVPPTPANYAQRAGRAGRRHRIAVVINYCGSSPHERYHFDRPEEMISGRIRVPAFSMSNEPMIRKHAHSAILTALRSLPADEVGDILQEAFPTWIWRYFAPADSDGKVTNKYLDTAPTFPQLHELVKDHSADICGQLLEAFAETWPEEDAAAVREEAIEGFAADMPRRLESHVNVLFQEVQNYRKQRDRLSQKEIAGEELDDEEKRDRDRYIYALRQLRRQDQERYALTYLSNDGYFPGYALSREACVARCLQPYIELNRPEALALREFTPANWIYAAGDVYAVKRIDFFSMRSAQPEAAQDVKRRNMMYDSEHERVIDLDSDDMVGRTGQEFTSFTLGGVELRQRQQIDDSRERRHYGAHDILGTFLGHHHGGQSGNLADIEWRLYRQAELRLVNLGPVGRDRDNRPIGFPICSKCGAVRSPYANDQALKKFVENHEDSCGKEAAGWAAMHVDFWSDLLMIGPLPGRVEAVNLKEAVLLGAREFLDMGDSELEGFVEEQDDESCWIAIYDPMPGGSGFLQQMKEHWPAMCDRAYELLAGCDCEDACYHCLLNFWNQRHHDILNRETAMNLLQLYATELEFGDKIPPKFEEPPGPDIEESDAEGEFTSILDERTFPTPEKQHSVQLDDGTMTWADFAYPDEKVLIYIDGMSEQIHGNPEQQRADAIARAKLRNEGYRITELTAQALSDDTIVNQKLNEIAVYLGREDLVE